MKKKDDGFIENEFEETWKDIGKEHRVFKAFDRLV